MNLEAAGNAPPAVPAPTLLLQQLLCPGLPPNANPANTSTPYNPYITVDFTQNTLPAAANANDWRQFNATAKVANYGTSARVSMGRTRPVHRAIGRGSSSSSRTGPPGPRCAAHLLPAERVLVVSAESARRLVGALGPPAAEPGRLLSGPAASRRELTQQFVQGGALWPARADSRPGRTGEDAGVL